jgi:hypothetical protein
MMLERRGVEGSGAGGLNGRVKAMEPEEESEIFLDGLGGASMRITLAESFETKPRKKSARRILRLAITKPHSFIVQACEKGRPDRESKSQRGTHLRGFEGLRTASSIRYTNEKTTWKYSTFQSVKGQRIGS